MTTVKDECDVTIYETKKMSRQPYYFLDIKYISQFYSSITCVLKYTYINILI